MGIIKNIENVFVDLRCNKVVMVWGYCFFKNETYFKVEYLNEIQAFVVETANYFEDAKQNLFEDDDLYSAALPNSELVALIKKDLIEYYGL